MLKFFLKRKKVSGFGKKSFGSDIDTRLIDTQIGPWFRFPIPKPGFGHTLLAYDPYLTDHVVNNISIRRVGGLIRPHQISRHSYGAFLHLHLRKNSMVQIKGSFFSRPKNPIRTYYLSKKHQSESRICNFQYKLIEIPK